MTAPAPWQCPSCSAWLAPHVAEHRCDPPSSGSLTVTPCAPGPAGSTGMSVNTTTLPGTVTTINVSGGSGLDLARAVREGIGKLSANNAAARWGMPGRVA